MVLEFDIENCPSMKTACYTAGFRLWRVGGGFPKAAYSPQTLPSQTLFLTQQEGRAARPSPLS
jgi:hypothetical protein